DEALDRGAQARLAHPVHARRRLGVEAAQPLELAARAGLEARQAGPDAVLDRRVVADVGVEEAELLVRAPVAAVEDTALLHVEGAGEDLAAAARDQEAEVLPKALAEELEEALRQVAPP